MNQLKLNNKIVKCLSKFNIYQSKNSVFIKANFKSNIANLKRSNKNSKISLYTVWVSNKKQKGIIEGLAFYTIYISIFRNKYIHFS